MRCEVKREARKVHTAHGYETDGCRYVLITPARNEAKFIELTIKSVVAQTLRPEKWVIVSDGSTDGTDDVVKYYAGQHDWIELVRRPERNERHFAAKVDAFNTGSSRLKNVSYEVIGNLDADISFEDRQYFEYLMGRFAGNPELGVAGTSYQEGNETYPSRVHSMRDVWGACQMFRRECFEAIGGYQPVRGGGIDLIAVLSAQAAGWQTNTFTDKVCIHHRTVGSAHCTNTCGRMLQTGRKDYLLGSHPAFEVFRGVYQMTNKPYLVGGFLILAGYLWAMLHRIERPIPRQLMELRRTDQLKRLRVILRRALSTVIDSPAIPADFEEV